MGGGDGVGEVDYADRLAASTVQLFHCTMFP